MSDGAAFWLVMAIFFGCLNIKGGLLQVAKAIRGSKP